MPTGREPRRPATPRWLVNRRARWALLGLCVLVLLMVALVVVRSRGDRGRTADPQHSLSRHIALIPVRDPTGEFTRLATFDTRTHRLRPWAGTADSLEGGSTSDSIDRFSATPSPDRSRVAFIEQSQDELPVPYVARPDGSDAHRLMTSSERPCTNTKRPAWSSDGQRMAVVCEFPDGSWSLWLVDARDGAGIRELITKRHDVELGAPTWDETGNTVYTWEGRPGRRDPQVGHPVAVPDDVADSDPQSVSGVADASYTEPDWSSSGLLVVHRTKDRDNKVVVVLEGQRSVVAEGTYLSATWAPDGHSILATLGPDQDHQRLALLPYPSGSAAQVSGVVANFGAPDWDTR